METHKNMKWYWEEWATLAYAGDLPLLIIDINKVILWQKGVSVCLLALIGNKWWMIIKKYDRQYDMDIYQRTRCYRQESDYLINIISVSFRRKNNKMLCADLL